MTEIAVDDPLRPHRRAERTIVRVDTGDTRDEPITLRKIETRIEPERHDRRRALRRAHARHHAEHAAVGIRPQIAVALRKRMHLRQLLALDPILKFTRTIPRVRPRFKHRHDHDFGPDHAGRGPRRQREREEHKNTEPTVESL